MFILEYIASYVASKLMEEANLEGELFVIKVSCLSIKFFENFGSEVSPPITARGGSRGGAKGASAPPSKFFCSNVNCTCNSMKTPPK